MMMMREEWLSDDLAREMQAESNLLKGGSRLERKSEGAERPCFCSHHKLQGKDEKEEQWKRKRSDCERDDLPIILIRAQSHARDTHWSTFPQSYRRWRDEGVCGWM
jgi:hypothetical protein